MIRATRLPGLPQGDRQYLLSDGKMLRISRFAALDLPEEEILARHGAYLSNEEVPVIHHGREVGTLPRSFDWANPGVKNPLVDIRQDDFLWSSEHQAWVASRTLGSGDLDAIPSFRRY